MESLNKLQLNIDANLIKEFSRIGDKVYYKNNYQNDMDDSSKTKDLLSKCLISLSFLKCSVKAIVICALDIFITLLKLPICLLKKDLKSLNAHFISRDINYIKIGVIASIKPDSTVKAYNIKDWYVFYNFHRQIQ